MRINFESSTACNARCTFCPRYDMTRPMGQMSDELFHKIIRDGKDLKASIYYPFMNGEPFVFPKIWQWLDYMEKEGVMIALHTNAEYMDVDRLIKYKNISYVYCSLSAATKETHEKVMRGPKYEVVKNNIDNLLKKARFRVRVSFVMTEDNIGDLELFQSQYKRNIRAVSYFANWTGARHSSFEKKGQRVPCRTIFIHMYILWDGRVVPCCMDYDGRQILGDANKQTLREIWNNALWLRNKHKRYEFDDIPICKNCNYNVI